MRHLLPRARSNPLNKGVAHWSETGERRGGEREGEKEERAGRASRCAHNRMDSSQRVDALAGGSRKRRKGKNKNQTFRPRKRHKTQILRGPRPNKERPFPTGWVMGLWSVYNPFGANYRGFETLEMVHRPGIETPSQAAAPASPTTAGSNAERQLHFRNSCCFRTLPQSEVEPLQTSKKERAGGCP